MNVDQNNAGWTEYDYFGTDGRWHNHDEDSSDDGYDAARDAYNLGYGPPVTRRQREDLRDEMDSRRYGW